jgi:hypothetical protein
MTAANPKARLDDQRQSSTSQISLLLQIAELAGAIRALGVELVEDAPDEDACQRPIAVKALAAQVGCLAALAAERLRDDAKRLGCAA